MLSFHFCWEGKSALECFDLRFAILYLSSYKVSDCGRVKPRLRNFDFNLPGMGLKPCDSELPDPSVKTLSENTKLVLDIFSEIYNKSQNKGNFEDIVNFYLSSIANTSLLTNSEKQALIASFSVASESPIFWLNQN